MNSPLDAFPSESSADAAPTRHAMVLSSEAVPSSDARPSYRRVRRSTPINRLRRRLIGAIDRVADTIASVASFLSTLPGRIVMRRLRPIRRPAWASNDRLAVVATAALTSAAVSQFTLWIGNEWQPPAVEPPLTEVSTPVDRTGMSAPNALPADGRPVPFWRAATPIAPRPPADPPPTPAVQTPPPRSLPRLLAQEYAEPQDAALTQDRPVLMDARMPVGTSGSAPPRPAPVASLARDRDRAAVAASRREDSRENSRRNSVAARPAAAPSRLVVITQPEGARVTINGVGWGVTPLTIGHLPPGAKRVRVTKPGYRSEERVVGKDAEAADGTLRIALRAVSDERQQ